MRTPLLELIRCPFCHADLAEEGDRLRCTGCGRTFGRSDDGIPLLLHEGLPGAQKKLREASGWLEKARAEGWYEPDDAVDAVLPFVNQELGWNELNWLANGHSFQVLLDRYVEGRRGLRVLEVGAAKAWASRFWLERDCEYVATDILVDANIGLGRGGQPSGRSSRRTTRPARVKAAAYAHTECTCSLMPSSISPAWSGFTEPRRTPRTPSFRPATTPPGRVTRAISRTICGRSSAWCSVATQ